MSKICIINQLAGLGDILFCQKIAYRALNEFQCKKVYWPVSNVYSYIGDYIIQDNVIFQGENHATNQGDSIINSDELLYIPLSTSDKIINYTNNRAHGHIKYKFFYDTDYTDWKNYFTLVRNFEREQKLMSYLNLDENTNFNLINPNFGTPPNFLTNNKIKPNNNYRNVHMDFIDGFNIFDWIGVIEKAKEIHTMETSLYYIIEKLNIEDNVFIYSKYKFMNRGSDDYGYMKSHCSNKWNYM